MNDTEIKCRTVRRMWRDDIIVNSQWADAETVARQSVPASDEGHAANLLLNDMADNPNCPVIKTGAGMVALRQNKAAVKQFLEAVCEDSTDIPWDLRS